jgi:hypothetical protein
MTGPMAETNGPLGAGNERMNTAVESMGSVATLR